jgi:lipoate-protein ligase B
MQHGLADRVRDGGDEALILLEHPPVYTFGVRGKQGLYARRRYASAVTYHGPGQIVGYPIMNLRARVIGPAAYVRAIEQVIIDALCIFEVDAERVEGRPGVWTSGAKIAAIGVRVSRGVTTHGFALNVNSDLSYFEHIIPCGIADASVTSMERVLGAAPAMRDVEDAICGAFSPVFETALTSPPALPGAERESSQEVSVGR